MLFEEQKSRRHGGQFLVIIELYHVKIGTASLHCDMTVQLHCVSSHLRISLASLSQLISIYYIPLALVGCDLFNMCRTVAAYQAAVQMGDLSGWPTAIGER